MVLNVEAKYFTKVSHILAILGHFFWKKDFPVLESVTLECTNKKFVVRKLPKRFLHALLPREKGSCSLGMYLGMFQQQKLQSYELWERTVDKLLKLNLTIGWYNATPWLMIPPRSFNWLACARIQSKAVQFGERQENEEETTQLAWVTLGMSQHSTTSWCFNPSEKY